MSWDIRGESGLGDVPSETNYDRLLAWSGSVLALSSVYMRQHLVWAAWHNFKCI